MFFQILSAFNLEKKNVVFPLCPKKGQTPNGSNNMRLDPSKTTPVRFQPRFHYVSLLRCLASGVVYGVFGASIMLAW